MLIKRLSIIVSALLLMSAFSFNSFAGYDFDEDGNTTGYTYNGTNNVYSNGIYVGTDPVTGLPIYKFEMDTINNTYNGTNNIHGNGDALFDGYDTNSNYNGTLDVVGTDVGPGTTTTISNANINAVTSISAAEANSENELNAGVLIQDSTFTNDVTIQSSTVQLNSEANVILGSSSQMDDLLTDSGNISSHSTSIDNKLTQTNNKIDSTNTKLDTIITRLTSANSFLSQIRDTLYIIRDNLLKSRWGTTTSVTTDEGISYQLSPVTVGNTTYYGNFHGIFRYYINTIWCNLTYPYNSATTSDANTYQYITWWGYPVIATKGGFSRFDYNSTTKTITESTVYYYNTYLGVLSRYFGTTLYSYFHANLLYEADYFASYFSGLTTYTFYTFTSTNNGEYYSLTTNTRTGTWWQVIQNRLDTLISLLNYQCSKFFEWYYPLDGAAPYYWRTYNSDTDQEESVNLARVLYDISWYLGHITIGEDIKTEVQSLSDNLTSYQTAEQNIQNQVTSYITSFAPDPTRWSAFVAMSWVSNYLTECLIALGTYGQVIMIGLLLGVCMQFIGYFRYKY